MDPNVKEQKTNGITSQPVPSVGTANKEGGVRANIELSENLPRVEGELAGIVKTTEQHVPNEPQIGLTPSAESTPVLTAPTGSVSLPISLEEAEAVEKESKHEIKVAEHIGDQKGVFITDSLPWLAKEVLKAAKRGVQTVSTKVKTLVRQPS